MRALATCEDGQPTIIDTRPARTRAGVADAVGKVSSSTVWRVAMNNANALGQSGSASLVFEHARAPWYLCRSWTPLSFACPGWSGTGCTMCCQACCRGWRTCWPGSLRIMQRVRADLLVVCFATGGQMGRRRPTLACIAKARAKGASRARCCVRSQARHSSG